MFKSFVLALIVSLTFALWCTISTNLAWSDEPAQKAAEKPAAEPPDFPPGEELPNLVRLAKDQDVWLDAKRKLVVVDGQICRQKGFLEMFACNKGTKEHESVVAINAMPWVVHAGLLAAGATAGKPVQFDPKYVPASGTVVDVWVLWKDKGMNRKVKAQEWIRHSKTGKAMDYNWVFGGSGEWRDEETKKVYYQADAGDVICVSNFPTAMLDLPVSSSQANDELEFEAFTERIPEKGTKVRLVLIPRLEKKEEPKKDAPKEK